MSIGQKICFSDITSINLNESINIVGNLRELIDEEKKEYIFKPDKSHFKSLLIVSQKDIKIPWKYRHVFLAVDSSDRIRKVTTFVMGQTGEIIKYLDKHLQMKHSIGTARKNGIETSRYYFWYTNQNTTVSLADFTDAYGVPVIMIEMIQDQDFDLTLKYLVTKCPDW